ncbi:MAG: class II fructose-bisphosphate aldolase [Clostridia bacterium]|nr:class II fructose-bisphosphate aldolase [Clostridia bacterium]
MLVSLKEILKIAEARKCAVGSFNTPNLTTLRAVIYAAEELNEPVIVMHAQIHEEMGVCRMDEMAPIMLLMADKARVPVCVHLDHGTDLGYVKKALDAGFTSVMYDGSELQGRLNYANTSIVVEAAKRYGASVEAEVGSMGAREGGAGGSASVYTEPGEAKAFVENTGIDALACAFGTAHGIYMTQPKLDFDRLAQIRQLVNVPLVMHGGSGVSEQDYRRVIELGIRKINYYTYMSRAGGMAVSHKEYAQFHDAEMETLDAMKADAMRAMKIFTLKEELKNYADCIFGEESHCSI